MKWHNALITYVPYKSSLDTPGDRRRFVFYAKERGIKIRLANSNEKYDIVYVTYGCNLSEWIEYKIVNPDVKLVFELIDSYLFESTGFLSIFRGLARFFLGRENSLWFDYKRALRKMIMHSDAVVCSTHAQQLDIVRYNKNTHIVLDFFSSDINYRKFSQRSTGKLKLVWEGQAHTAINLLSLSSVFRRLGNRIELCIITDPVIRSPVSILDRKTASLLSSLECDYYFVDWDSLDFCRHISGCDLAIIPLANENPMMWNKPENKLLMFWEIGIPTLVSGTPAYKRVMDLAGLDFYCSTAEDWFNKISFFISSSVEYRESMIQKAELYISKYHTKEALLASWDSVFDSL